MKFSESWLREWANPAVDTDKLVAQLTMAGLEVDSVAPVAAEFSGVVVGQIVAVEPHPDADKLRVCQVTGNGEAAVQVVCGAPNAREGLKIPFATVGAKLPGDFTIKKAKLRGVESFGMLCAEEELGFADSSDGLWELAEDAPVGQDIRDYLSLNDQVIEVDLTPNRGDCLSIRGLAREAAVINQTEVTEQACEAVPATVEDSLSVSLDAPEGCARYAGRVIKNVDLARPSPVWLQEKLRRSGVRSIDPIVDVTNYVMLELGQPMHAFDLNTLNGGIVVRMAKQAEQLTLLDGSKVKLNADTLVIADEQKSVAMAGIMGGADTAVTAETRDIFLESAFFHPLIIAGRPRTYGIHTDSSHRFERGVDPALQVAAIERATALLLDIVGGEAGPVVCEESTEQLPQQSQVTLRKSSIKQQLGLSLDDTVVEDMLTRLGLKMVGIRNNSWIFAAPSWRFDIDIEADLIEEIARIHGYNNLPTATLAAPLPISVLEEAQVDVPALRQQLVARGYRESITYSFVDPAVQQQLDPAVTPVALANPIASDMAVMRTTLWSGLLPALRHNLNHQQNRVRLFETGLRFVPEGDELSQQQMIAGVITGARQPENWTNEGSAVDFFDLKADVEALLGLNHSSDEFNFVASQHPALHSGQCAAVERNGELVGYLGKLHPVVQKGLDIGQPVFAFELLLSAVVETALPAFTVISKFPEMRRDLAFIVDANIPVGDMVSAVYQAAGEFLVDLKVFDVYQGKGIENNRKSVAMGLTFRASSRTLTEDEINIAVEQVVGALGNQYSASLRG